jgi:predicted amidohydrolase YtcJ
MIAAGIPCGLSSDCPVETLDAFACLSSAVNRHPWSPHETLSVDQAIAAYCQGSAYCGHRERFVGTLRPGFAADFVVLSADPRQIAPASLMTLRAQEVFVGGQAADAGSPIASAGVCFG